MTETERVTATQIDTDAVLILEALERAQRNEYVDRSRIASETGLTPERINDAMALLVNAGHVEWIQTFGTAPFDFSAAMITARGRYEQQRLRAAREQTKQSTRLRLPHEAVAAEGPRHRSMAIDIRPPAPVGSPFGFTDQDWEIVAARRKDAKQLYTVLGHPFSSTHFNAGTLRAAIEAMLNAAVDRYNAQSHAPPVMLRHRALTAGYGEHLFNEIARDIISADIAVFETSDLNPNVMLEIGVALTWGVRVLPIKLEGCEKPPSDVSGQTWADYREDGTAFVDPEHEQKLVIMIERALYKKIRTAV